MDINEKGLIEYSGLTTDLPKNPYSFKHLNLRDRLYLPDDNTNIKQLVKVSATTDVINTRIIKTPKATSYDGRILTGWGLIVENHLDLKIEYIPEHSSYPIEILYFTIPFNAFLVLPEHFKTKSPIKVTGYIQDIFAEKIDERQIVQNTFVLLNAVMYL